MAKLENSQENGNLQHVRGVPRGAPLKFSFRMAEPLRCEEIATQNKMRGNLSNDETVGIAQQYLKGDLIEKSKVFDTAIAMTNALSSLRMTKESSNLDLMIKSLTGEMKGLRGDLRGLPSKMPTSHSGFNNKTGMVEHISKKLGREQKVLERLNRS